MKQKRFSEKQIVEVLKRAEGGVKVVDICREAGISDATFYTWRKKYKGMSVKDVRELKELRDENRKLKELVAELSLEKRILQEVLSKKV